jgi:hypothetical protein
MKPDDSRGGGASEQPQPLNYRAPRDDRALRGAPASPFRGAYAALGACVGLIALPTAVILAAPQTRIEPRVAVVAVVLLAICCVAWKPMRPFGIGLLMGMGADLLLFGACFAAFS